MELIGRDGELATLRERLRRRRLVTVVGAGGIGQTALAKAVLDAEQSRFELGGRVVDLTRVDSADAVGGALAGQLGFPSFDALVNSPSEHSVLLLVDNCEHVTSAAAAVISELLAACQTPSVIATSRSPLDVPGEALVPIGPLQLPRTGALDADAPAVRLFLERARDAGVELDDGDLAAVVEICRRLDGVPLAIELAAARTRYWPPAEILDRLATGMDVLIGPPSR